MTQEPKGKSPPSGEREDLMAVLARLEPIEEDFAPIEDYPPEPFELED